MSLANCEEIHINGCTVHCLKNGTTPEQYLTTLAQKKTSQHKTNAFYVADLSDVISKYRKLWSVQLPMIHPFYAMKCNDDPAVMAIMADLGVGFDCASKTEIRQVLKLLEKAKLNRPNSDQQQLSPAERIIFANPCKKPSHIRFAAENGVNLMTFDSEEELRKVKALHPKAEMVVRLKPVGNDGRVEQGVHMTSKFGCTVDGAERLLSVAKELGVNVVGVAFHVGNLCFDATIYRDLIRMAREVFDFAAVLGYKFNLLDIGGGFYGNKQPRVGFDYVAAALRQAIDEFFADYKDNLRIIAEPGQFFVASAYTLANSVIGVKPIIDGNPAIERDVKDRQIEYHATLGTGAFSSMLPYTELVFFVVPKPVVLDNSDRGQLYQTTLWGPTCTGYDCIGRSFALPKLRVGDWIIFENMGAYTQTMHTEFNRMPKAKVFYVINEEDVDELDW